MSNANANAEEANQSQLSSTHKAEVLINTEDNIEDVESFDSGADTLFDEGDFSKTYLAKSRLITEELNRIGWGKYHTGLFIVCGFGWFADNAFPIACSLIMIALTEVDGVHSTYLFLLFSIFLFFLLDPAYGCFPWLVM